MTKMGKRTWAIPGGHIPLDSTGPEPRWTSFDKVFILNANDEDASVELLMFYTDREAVGPYRITVKARRLRTFRVNDLIDPEAPPLDTDYSIVIRSDVPIIVQFFRQDTARAENAMTSTMAYYED